MKKKKILIIDDEIEFVGLLEERLEALGYSVSAALNGYEGLEKVHEDKPDIIILDIMMPAMGGFDVCRKLKIDEAYKDIPIIILTAKFQPNDMEFAKEMGADAYLTKPLQLEMLSDKVKELLAAGPSKKSVGYPMKKNSKKILIADDERDLVALLTRRLETDGYEVIAAYDGEEALAKAYEARPDLIVLDIMMPKINGFDVCRKLKIDAAYKDIPIVMLTARFQPADIRFGKAQGADIYITKPFEANELLGKIRELLAK